MATGTKPQELTRNRMKIKNLLALGVCLLLIPTIKAVGQQVLPLYDGKIPNSIDKPDQEHGTDRLTKVSRPTLTVFEPLKGKANGTAVIICPGGGYLALSVKAEGYDVAKKLDSLGITAFVLKYRLPSDSTMVDKSIGPLQDAQRAIMLVKMHAKEFNIDTTKIGIMGFSAGGHLAASAGTHFNKSFIDNPNGTNLRPAFMILAYPLISLTDSIGLKISRNALLGKNPGNEQITYFSNELHVDKNTPPTFLIQAEDDELVSVKNSIVFYLALQKNKVPAGLHIFPKGKHAFLLEPAKSNWFSYCAGWLRENGWIKQ
jgi:acetyl esterase/lipase